VALVDDVEDAAAVGEAGVLGLALQDPIDEIVLAIVRVGIDLELAADLAELGDAHLAEIGDVDVVSLSRGFELLELLMFCYWKSSATTTKGRATTGTAIARGALIRAGHLDRGHLWVKREFGRSRGIHAQNGPRG